MTVPPTSDEREGLIHIDVAAERQQGSPFGDDLTAADLTLLQDGTVTKIVSFERSNRTDENEHLSEVSLVLDEVDLSPDEFALARDAAVSFLHRNDGVLAAPVSIVWIKSDGIYTSAFASTDGLSLAQDIVSGHLFPTNWMFHLAPHPRVTDRDASWIDILRTVYGLAVKWKNRPGRKALIWIGYGWSITGKLDAKPFPILVELSTRIREARTVIYEIDPWPDPEGKDQIRAIDKRYLSGVRSPSDPGMTSPVHYFALSMLALQSGGLVLAPSNDLESDIGRCITDASKFYTVSFDPPHAAVPDEFHDLKVLQGTGQLRMRTSYGYYNQPVFYDEPRTPEKRLNIFGLQQLLESEHRVRDKKLANELSSLELTERLSAGLLSKLKERLHGKEARSALTALGDESAFLPPPKAEIGSRPPPNDSSQLQIILRAEKYLDNVVSMLPDFSADATTTKYEQPLIAFGDPWKTAPSNRSMVQTVSEKATLLYRNGREQRIVEKELGNRRLAQSDLNYKGIFGPILGFVLEDVRHGNSKLVWSRWEQTDQGTLAVFHYSVRSENPRYGVVYCCLANGHEFDALPEHHGELAIDPESGVIFRITVESEPKWIHEIDLRPLRPVRFSNMMVEYGPVTIGGKGFICPKRSVAMTRQRTVRPITFWGMNFSVYGPYQTLMNDTSYSNYHKFGSESRMLPGFVEVRQSIPH